VKFVVFDETAGGAGPGASSRRESHPAERWHDRERQRQDRGPRLRQTTPERSGCAARRDRGQGLIRIERCWASREGTRELTCDSCQSWRLAVKPGSTRSCPPSRFRPDAEHGSPLYPRKPVERVIRGSSDPWGARDVRSVADVGRTRLPQRGEAGRKAESTSAGSA
jgi:hypothetical protein